MRLYSRSWPKAQRNRLSPPPPSPPTKTGPLTLDRILADLVADKLVAKADGDKLANERRHHRGDEHPLIVVAEQKWKDPRSPRRC